MDKLQQLRTLVRKRHDENWGKRNNGSGGNLYWERALEDAKILEIIDSIPRFKVGDVIKSGSYTYTIKDMDEDSYILEGDKVLTFNAQYDWELMATMDEEPVSKDLEEAAQNWWEKTRLKSDLSGNPINSFKAGAKWKEEQMMKDVVLETTIIKDWDGCAEDGNESEWLAYEDDEVINMPEWCEEGDKVKLVLIKSEMTDNESI